MVSYGEALSAWCTVLECIFQSLCDITFNIWTHHPGPTAIIQYAGLEVSIPKSMEQSTSWQTNLQLFKTFSLFMEAEDSLPSLPQPVVESVLSGMGTVQTLLSYFSLVHFGILPSRRPTIFHIPAFFQVFQPILCF